MEYKKALVRSFEKTSTTEPIPESKEVVELTTSLQTLQISNGKPCGFCKREIHIPKMCTEFKKFKDKCTSKSYISSKPTKRDLNGYCSGAVLLYGKYKDEIYILTILEIREGKPCLNLPGGKREYRNEKPRQCALREMSEELKDCPITIFNFENYKCTKTLYLWYAKGKYFIIPLQYTFNEAPAINEQYKWINIKNLGIENIYPFTADMINTFKLDKADNVCYS